MTIRERKRATTVASGSGRTSAIPELLAPLMGLFDRPRPRRCTLAERIGTQAQTPPQHGWQIGGRRSPSSSSISPPSRLEHGRMLGGVAAPGVLTRSIDRVQSRVIIRRRLMSPIRNFCVCIFVALLLVSRYQMSLSIAHPRSIVLQSITQEARSRVSAPPTCVAQGEHVCGLATRHGRSHKAHRIAAPPWSMPRIPPSARP
jgi:hypothetical protein